MLKSSENVVNATLDFLKEHYPDFVDCVPKEVLTFGLPDRFICVVAGILILILSLVSLSGNILLIYLYFKHSTLRTSANKLVVNLSFTNALMHFKSWIIIINCIAGGPILEEMGKF